MFCYKCGQQLPDDAKFCFKCGTSLGGAGSASSAAAPPKAPAAPPVADAGVAEFKCPSCGAPLHPVYGEAVISCDYCGSSVSLAGNGWREISKHTMLVVKIGNADDLRPVLKAYLDTGLFNRKRFEESTITDEKLTFVPYWVLPVSATTNYQYQDMAVSVGGTVGTLAAGALLSGAMNRGRGGGTFIMLGGGGMGGNATRQDTITGTYEYPVVAVRSLNAYQPKDYQFSLTDRALFDKKQVPQGTPVLNGDLTEEAARNVAKSYVSQLQSEAAHHKHGSVSHLSVDVQVSEGELLHAPIWQITLDRKGQRTGVLIDAHAGRVMTPIS